MPGGSPGLAPRDGHWWVHNRPFQFKKCTAVSLAIPSSSHLLGASFMPEGRKLPSHVCEKKSHAQLKYLSCYRLNCYLLKGHENDKQRNVLVHDDTVSPTLRFSRQKWGHYVYMFAKHILATWPSSVFDLEKSFRSWDKNLISVTREKSVKQAGVLQICPKHWVWSCKQFAGRHFPISSSSRSSSPGFLSIAEIPPPPPGGTPI